MYARLPELAIELIQLLINKMRWTAIYAETLV
jgi:hypothetical protein